jgi:LmbE family N-acetylglucosaminyl deacetylase
MLTLAFGGADRPLATVLAIGAHSDDIEIGCGGTILRLVEAYSALEVWWIVLSAVGERAREAEASAETFLAGAAKQQVSLHAFRDGFFPHEGAAIKECFEELKRQVAPDIIFTHRRDDAHQDHRLVGELTWNTFRNHLILEYEIPKYDGDLGTPNLYIALDQETCRRKVDALLRHFPSQRQRPWFTEDLFLALPRLRGMESNAPDRLAEGFYCRKLVVAPRGGTRR